MFTYQLKRPAVSLCAWALLLGPACDGSDERFDSRPDAGSNVGADIGVPVGEAPIANAGPDQNVRAGTTVVLSAAASQDPDGGPLRVRWTQDAGPEVTLSATDTATVTFDAPPTDVVVALTFTVRVTDDEGLAATDQVVVRLYPDLPPTVSLRFPCPGCRVFAETLSVSGSSVRATRIQIEAGSEMVDATIDAEGNWSVEAVPWNQSVRTASITITAWDLFETSTSTSVAFDVAPTFSTVFAAFDPVRTDTLYLAEGDTERERVFALNLEDGSLRKLYEEEPDDIVLWLGNTQAIAVDTDGRRIFLGDRFGRITAIDVDTGERSVVSDQTVGTGPSIIVLFDLVPQVVDDQLFLVDLLQDALFSVDLATGDRSIVSDGNGIGDGPPLTAPRRLAVDPVNALAYVSQRRLRHDYLVVDLATGDRALLRGVAGDKVDAMSFDARLNALVGLTLDDGVAIADLVTDERRQQTTHPSGLTFNRDARVHVDPHQDRYIITDFARTTGELDEDRIVAVTATTAATATWTVLFADTIGTGPQLQNTPSVAFDEGQPYVYLAGSATTGVVRVDLRTKARRTISGSDHGLGPPLGFVSDIIIDNARGRALISDETRAALVAVDLASGDRHVISDATTGDGPAIMTPTAIALSADANRVYLVDIDEPAIFEVDLATGHRVVLSDNTHDGPELQEPVGIALDRVQNRLLLGSSGPSASSAVVTVDLTTGARAVLSDVGRGGGPPLVGMTDLRLLDDRTALVLASDTLIRVDLETGDRTSLSDHSRGRGPLMLDVASFAFNADRSLVYTHDLDRECLMAIDIGTGDRVVVSK